MSAIANPSGVGFGSSLALSNPSTIGDDGYVVLDSLLDAVEVARVRAMVTELRDARAVGACERPNNTLVPLRWDDDAVTTALRDPVVMRRIAAATDGTDVRWTSGYVSIKDPRSGPLWWHQDWWCWTHPITRAASPPQVALCCYLDDTTVETGALRVLPGTHRPPWTERAWSGDEERFDDHPEQVSLPARAGDAVVLDYRLLHGTHPNLGAHRRDCLILNFTPSWHDLPDDIRAHLIGGLALPTPDERPAAVAFDDLLPHYDGEQRDLELVREPPSPSPAQGILTLNPR